MTGNKMQTMKSTLATPSQREAISSVHECFHCGEPCDNTQITLEDKVFCCVGCKTVYEILNQNDLCTYYNLETQPGISLKGRRQEQYAFLDDTEVQEQLIDYTDETKTNVTFHLPQIHCASCIWLLENLYKLNDGINHSTVNFLKKEIKISYLNQQTSLRKIVELLASIGYAPEINLGSLDAPKKRIIDRSFAYKLGVAGFAFGNIMLLSFPEYLGLNQLTDSWFQQLFGYLNILLALPVVFYSGFDYLRSAWLGLQQRNLNIDVPIALGILTLFGRSLFEILSHTGAGYLDSLAGLVFFLLIGKWFQQRTYYTLSFERDYKSYFPLATTVRRNGAETTVTINKLEEGDTILVRNGELIPADGLLLKGEAQIDYSFVTGEADPVARKIGDKLFAGGRQIGGAIELTLTRKVSQSYLTQLWNDSSFHKKDNELAASKLANQVGKYFTFIILTVAFATLTYWLPRDIALAINAFTAVLIIACPCAVALSIPFTFGNVLRILGRQQFYLKNTNVIESLQKIRHIVLDKTGTITNRSQHRTTFVGKFSEQQKELILALAKQSSHPASQQIVQFLTKKEASSKLEVTDFKEIPGQGISGTINGKSVQIGSANFVQSDKTLKGTFVKIDGQVIGYFSTQNSYRQGLQDVFAQLKERYDLHLLSGDNDREKVVLAPLFPSEQQLHFNQSPQDKLHFIKDLQRNNANVLMLGDGLNDAGALQQSEVGIVIAENTNNFTPACDAILDARQFARLPLLLDFARRSVRLVFAAYGLALIYNIIGLSFAVQGALSPVIAAILMPLSSITIVIFGMLSSTFLAWRMGVFPKK